MQKKQAIGDIKIRGAGTKQPSYRQKIWSVISLKRQSLQLEADEAINYL